MSDKPFTVMSQRLAGYLMMKGFTLRGLKANFRDPKRNVFLFNQSDELAQAIEEYSKPNK